MTQTQIPSVALEGTNGAAPVALADRIKSIDTIRGFALLGILLMNIPGFAFGFLEGNLFNDISLGPHSGYDYLTLKGVEIFFNGTMRGLFSMLFGAGMLLFMMNKKEAPGQASVAVYYYRRLLWLVLFGLINAFVLLWFGDILFYYGLFGMLLFAFRKLAPKWLLILGLACISFAMIKSAWSWSEQRNIRANYLEAQIAKKEKKTLTDEQKQAESIWSQWTTPRQKSDTAENNKNIRIMQSGYIGIFKELRPQTSGFEVYLTYSEIWDMLSMMFIGMALLGWGFFTNKLSTQTYVLWLIVGYGIGIPFGFFLFNNSYYFYPSFAQRIEHWRLDPYIFGEVRRLLITIGHASLIMLTIRLNIVPWLMRALAAVGQMAFTNYLMQSIICTFFFFGYGFGYFGKLHLHQIYYVVAAVWIFQLIFSSIWLRYFRFGPFEWVWRSLTYWKKQPMKL
jgi:uncharacterized protein